MFFTRKVRDKFFQLLALLWNRNCTSVMAYQGTRDAGSLNADERRHLLNRQKMEADAKCTPSYSSEHTPPLTD